MAKMFIPNSDRVLVDVRVEEKIGSIHVPMQFEDNRRDPKVGVVVAVGPGKIIDLVEGELVPPLFAEGDVVLVDMIGGLKIKLDDKEYLLVRNEEILGTICETEEEKKPSLTSV